MMRQIVLALVILVCRFTFAEDGMVSRPQVLNMMYGLWQDSGFGKDPNRAERAAWVVNDSVGGYLCIRWPRSDERNRELWRGEVPPNTIGQVHTHPVNVDPRPSRKDIALAIRTGMPIYTISDRGIWMADSYGAIYQVCTSNWYKDLDRGCRCNH